ncbi:MAG: nucleotidyltransferase family protein [Spirochaetales bacterium]
MKLAVIVCEYNPFHNGHLYQINKTRELTNCDGIICIMSGNFSQRAECAIMDKYERAKVAIECGADLVVNIPAPYASNNAEVFALASVKIASAFKDVEWISFGMEEPNLNALNETAEFLLNETTDYKILLKNYLDSGLSFSESRIQTVKKLIAENKVTLKNKEAVINLLTKPNNILAVEYVKALKTINSNIKPVLVQRLGSDYNEEKFEGTFSSATAIRKSVYNGEILKVKAALPKPSFEALENYVKEHGLVDENKLIDLARYKFLTTNTNELKTLYNVSEGLENRIKIVAIKSATSAEFKEQVHTKRYKNSRINSILLNGVLNIHNEVIKHVYKIEKLPFIKALAINENNKELLSNLKCSSKLILRKNDVDNLKKTKYVKELMQIEDNSNAVYNLLLNKNLLPAKDIYTKLIKVK